MGALGALLEASWALQVAKMQPEGSPRRSKIDSQRRLALKTRILQKALFSQRIFMVFEVPGRILKASWLSSRHLGPLEGLLKHLGRILGTLGGLLERLGGILSALGAILAENVALTCLETAWKPLGTCIGSAPAGGPARGGGSILSSRVADLYSGPRSNTPCSPEVCGGLYPRSRVPPTQGVGPLILEMELAPGLLGCSWRALGGALGGSWTLMGGSWAAFAASWAPGALLERPWKRPGALLKSSWGRLGDVLEALEGSFEASGGLVEASWRPLEDV